MALSKLKRAYLVKHMGEARVAALERGLEEKEEELKSGGIDFKEFLDKCMDCGPSTVEIVPPPLAGAMSFAEADKFDEAEETESYVGRLERRFGRIVDNIFGTDASLDKKVAQVKHAVAELGNRLKSPQRQKALLGSKAGPPLSEFAQGSGQDFADYDKDLSLGVFSSIVDTIVRDHKLSPDEKVGKLQGAVADLRQRLQVKALRESRNPGARALAQIAGPSRTEHAAKELKELAESPTPGARGLAQIMVASGPGRQG